MNLPPEIDDYIKGSIDHSLGLPVSSQTLDFKLCASQESEQRLRDQNLFLLQKLKEKDQFIERARDEASTNAQAVKKFVEENQKLASECENLVAQCQKLEKEIALYDHDREALMEFGNEADERAMDAQMRAEDLERDLILMEIELKKYQNQENESVNSSPTSTLEDENLLDSLLATVTSKDESSIYEFLHANTENEYSKKLLSMWSSLTPSTRRVLSLVVEVLSLEKDKEHLKINLHRAEEEVKLLFDENSILEKENRRLLRKCKEMNHPGSGGKLTGSTSAKSNKRKSSPKTSSPMARNIDFDDISNKRKSSPKTSSPMPRMIDFDDTDTARQPLSPLRINSPDCHIYKK